MDTMQFEGQQTDERVLSVVAPHVFAKNIAIAKIVFLSVFFYLFLLIIATVAPSIAGFLRMGGLILSAALFLFGIWWNNTVFSQSKTYITDRRIIRFEVVSPFFKTKRALFWNEALKAKGYAPNLLYRYLKIGTLVVEPQNADHEDVQVTNVYYFEDLANYIDKILFTFKNKPTDVALLQPFVAKPKGHREEH